MTLKRGLPAADVPDVHALVAAVVALLPASASNAYPQDWVFWAYTSAVRPYGVAHDGWAGMTTRSLLHYNRNLRYVRVVRAARTSYCIEANVDGATAAEDTMERVRFGTCSRPGAVATVHTFSEAKSYVRAAIPAIEAWNADHGSYSGMTLAGLRTYDRVKNVTVVRAARTTYCVESQRGIWAAFKNGPAADIRSGRCPR